MKALIIQGSDDKFGGGIESFVSTLIQNEKMKDVKFTILYPGTAGSEKTVEEDGAITHYPIEVPFNLESKLFKQIDLMLFNIFLLFSKKVFSDHYDVIHVNGIAGALIPYRFSKRSLFTIHGNALVSFMEQRSLYSKSQLVFNFLNSLLYYTFELFALKFSRIVVSVSPSVRNKFARISNKSIIVVPNGIEFKGRSKSTKAEIEKKYNIKEGAFICLWVGRNPERKGLSTAINSLINIDSAYLLVVGTPRLTPLVNNKNVIYCGNLTRTDLDGLYTTSDLLIFPSRYEAMSYTIIEALSVGLPVIAFRKEFITDIVGMNYPLLCDSEGEFRMKIKDLMTWSKEDIGRLRELSISISRNFTADAMATKYFELYREISDEKQ